MKDHISFRAEGWVLGDLWGGGKGYYPARKYYNRKLPAMKKKIRKDFKSGALDSGMGYQRLTGALMFITRVTVKKIDGKEFKNEETTGFKLGNIDESDLFSAIGGS